MDLPSARNRRFIVVGALAFAAIMFAIAILVYLGNPRSTDLPVAIQAVSPVAQSNVLAQSDVVVDLAVGYTGTIDINGVPIPAEEINEASALNQFRFQPGEGKVIERLFPDQNCVRVTYWQIAIGPADSQTYSWCFFAS